MQLGLGSPLSLDRSNSSTLADLRGTQAGALVRSLLLSCLRVETTFPIYSSDRQVRLSRPFEGQWLVYTFVGGTNLEAPNRREGVTPTSNEARA